MANTGNYASTVKVGVASVASPDTSLTAPTTTGVLATGGASGTRIDRVNFKATGATTAGLIRLFINRSGTYYLLREITLTGSISPTTTVKAFDAVESSVINPDVYPIHLYDANDTLEFTITTAQASPVRGIAFGGDY